MNDIRSMDAGGMPRVEIARRLGVSRHRVAKYADMEDMSPAAPAPAPRPRPALAGHEAWVESVVFGQVKVSERDCGGDPGPNPSYAARPKSLRYCMGLL